jgi:hypothetical protein
MQSACCGNRNRAGCDPRPSRNRTLPRCGAAEIRAACVPRLVKPPGGVDAPSPSGPVGSGAWPGITSGWAGHWSGSSGWRLPCSCGQMSAGEVHNALYDPSLRTGRHRCPCPHTTPSRRGRHHDAGGLVIPPAAPALRQVLQAEPCALTAGPGGSAGRWPSHRCPRHTCPVPAR